MRAARSALPPASGWTRWIRRRCAALISSSVAPAARPRTASASSRVMSVRGPRGGAVGALRQSAQPAVEVGLQDAQRIGIARAFGMQFQQVAVRQPIQPAPGEAAQDRAADIAGGVIDPRLEEGGVHLGALARARRAEAAGRPLRR